MSTHSLPELEPGFHQFRHVIEGDLGFEVFVWRGETAGKTLLLNGATHGDEYEGPTFLSELARDWRPRQLSGTVIAIPVLHEAAFFAGRRESPVDGKNLARVFPGDPNGTPTEQIAHAFENHFIAQADFYVDFHSAGASYEILPWAGYLTTLDTELLATQRKMARCFPDVWHWGTPYLPGRTISAAFERNIPAIYLEFFGAGNVANADHRRLRIGFQNLLRVCGQEEGPLDSNDPLAIRESAPDPDNAHQEGHLQLEYPAPCNGILTRMARLGARIRKGDIFAVIQPLDGSPPQTVFAQSNGRVTFRRRQRSISQGETLGSITEI